MSYPPTNGTGLHFTSIVALTLSASLYLAGCGDEKRVADLEAKVSAKSEELATAQASLDKLGKTNAQLSARAKEAEEKSAKLGNEVSDLSGELDKKKEMLTALEAVESELASRLVSEVEAGDIHVARRDGYLVVSVSDKVLFETGKAELKEAGKEILSRLAESLIKLPKDQLFQIGGHTDNQPIKSEEVKANFPTNWELSTARATNVVRHLQENCKVPGKRLVAAGFAEYRPVASNKKGKGRKRNRRIEIALLPQHK